MGNALAGHNADVWVTSTPSISVANESMNDISVSLGQPTGTVFQTSVHKFWDRTAPFVVQQSTDGGSTWQTATNVQAIYYAAGQVQFSVAKTFVRLHPGSYFAASRIDMCQTWELTFTGNTTDTTIFQQSWKTFTPTTKQHTCKLGTFIVDASLATQLNNLLIFALYVDYPNHIGWLGYAILTTDIPKNDSQSVVSQEVDMTGVGPMTYGTI